MVYVYVELCEFVMVSNNTHHGTHHAFVFNMNLHLYLKHIHEAMLMSEECPGVK